MRLARIILFSSVGLAVILGIAGCCCRKGTDSGADIVAEINKYKMTVEDFRDEARLTAATKYLPADREKAKEELLDEIITKKVLLEEAQRQNFDKNKPFMKEIERYWEQALLKLLIKKKMGELGSAEKLDKWVSDMRKKANVKIYKENLKKINF